MPRRIVVAWSGGIDSTALVRSLSLAGHDVEAVLFESSTPQGRREVNAVQRLWVSFKEKGPNCRLKLTIRPGHVLNAEANTFSDAGRNRRIIKMLREWSGSNDIGVGQYTGTDTWLVKDHVGAEDCDARALTAWAYGEWGDKFKLWTLDDIGESRYKADRLQLLLDVCTQDEVCLTTNCLRHDSDGHCGECYKCIERAASFRVLGYADSTVYKAVPDASLVNLYAARMRGRNVRMETKGHDTLTGD